MRVLIPRSMAPSAWEARHFFTPPPARGLTATPPTQRFLTTTFSIILVIAFVGVSAVTGHQSLAVPDFFGGTAGAADPAPDAGPVDPAAPTSGGAGGAVAASLPEGYSPLHEDQGRPVLANACASVTYRLNQDNIPPGGTETVSEAIRETAELTGLSIVPSGATDNAGLNIEIAYRPESQDSNLSGDPIGVTHTQAGGMFGHMTLTQATIILEDEWFQDAITHDPELAVQVVVHELGHALGLAHVNDPISIMHPSAGATQPNQTDKQAFRALNAGCNTTAGPRAPEGKSLVRQGRAPKSWTTISSV